MKNSMFCIYDTIGQYYTPPFFAMNTGDALRTVSSVVNSDQEIPICTNPADFILYEIGSFDDSSATIETHAEPKFLTHCSSLKRGDNQND